MGTPIYERLARAAHPNQPITTVRDENTVETVYSGCSADRLYRAVMQTMAERRIPARSDGHHRLSFVHVIPHWTGWDIGCDSFCDITIWITSRGTASVLTVRGEMTKGRANGRSIALTYADVIALRVPLN